MIIESKSEKAFDDDETLQLSISEKLKNYVPGKDITLANFEIDLAEDEPEYDPGSVWDGYDR